MLEEFTVTSWGAHAYMCLQGKTKKAFVCIFLYIGINKMFGYFLLYHEMDFSQSLDEFDSLYQNQCLLF